MTIKDIHVHVDTDEACSKRLRLAANFSEKTNAHLTGLFVSKPFPLPSHDMFPATADVIETYQSLLGKNAAKAREIFFKTVDESSPTISWRAVNGSFTYELGSEARYSDLLILGQPDPDDSESLNNGLADEIIFTAGRPCLLIPRTYDNDDFGNSPLIAWDGSREASRAIHDALPLLTLAGKATLLIVDPKKTDTNFGDMPGTMMSEHLARHDLDITIEVIRSNSQSAGDAILSYAKQFDHDLVVMGAYGHSRWREIILGGATRSIIQNTQVPIFMSH